MESCNRCERIPEAPRSCGTLFLAMPMAHSLKTLRKSFQNQKLPFSELPSNMISIDLVEGRLDEVLHIVQNSLSEPERRDTRALMLNEKCTPSLIDLMNTMALSTLIAKVQDRWLVEMIRDKRLTTHFQPIVRTEKPDVVFAYECLLRGRKADGSLMSPVNMYDAARDAEILFQLDRAARLTAIRESLVHRIKEHLFINFNPSTIYDPAYCLKTTISAIEAAGIHPDRIYFEVVESDQVDVDLLGIMNFYRRAGFHVVLDDLGAGYGSLNLLSKLRPDVVKLDMKLVRDVDLDHYKAGITSKLIEMARQLGILTVAEGVETAGEFEWFRNEGVDFVQGYYIARPASPPPRLKADDKPAVPRVETSFAAT